MSTTPLYFPPYGRMDRSWGNPDNPPNPPSAFEPKAKWEAWMARILAVLNESIWPCWDPTRKTWTDCGAKPSMEPLTLADFDIMRAMGADRGLDTQPVSDGRTAVLPTHRILFQIEDNGTGHSVFKRIGSYYKEYDSSLDVTTAERMQDDIGASWSSRIGDVNTHIKFRLQRPRAYQMAMLVPGQEDFFLLRATTALSPSACSGHCMYGLVGIAGVADDWADAGIQLTPHNRGCLQQYAVDFGDRRVMAGVHFPSDNLSSWIISLALSDYLFRPHVRTWMREAIERSVVYQHVKRVAGPYTAGLDTLERIAQNGFPLP